MRRRTIAGITSHHSDATAEECRKREERLHISTPQMLSFEACVDVTSCFIHVILYRHIFKRRHLAAVLFSFKSSVTKGPHGEIVFHQLLFPRSRMNFQSLFFF